MEGNELDDNCLKCEKICEEDQYFKCDSCLRKVHKLCINISTSETRCMPLQKRVLLFLCGGCKQLVARMPYMIKMMEEIKKDIELLKGSTTRGSYAAAVQVPNRTVTIANSVKTLPTLIIKPKLPQGSGASMRDIQKSINPANLNVGIRNIRETKQGGIVVKCDTKQELERFKNEVLNKFNGKYETELPKKMLPKVKIIGYTGNESIECIEETIRKQNNWIDAKQHFKVTYVRKQNKLNNVIYAECSGSLYFKMMEYKRLYINYERLPVYEDVGLSRCYGCQGFYHKSNKCTKTQHCGSCGEEDHITAECKNQNKKCINCSVANTQYKMQYDVHHAALDPICPSLKYHMELVRSKIDYNL